MHPERHQFLSLRRTPARLNAEETAWFLGFLPHEIPVLMGAKLLKPLGAPAANGCKYFSVFDLEQLKDNPEWLAKASNAIVKNWREKNLRKTKDRVSPSTSARTSRRPMRRSTI
jgi:hypothetical protein